MQMLALTLLLALFPPSIYGFFCNQMTTPLGTIGNANYTNYTGVSNYTTCFTFATQFTVKGNTTLNAASYDMGGSLYVNAPGLITSIGPSMTNRGSDYNMSDLAACQVTLASYAILFCSQKLPAILPQLNGSVITSCTTRYSCCNTTNCNLPITNFKSASSISISFTLMAITLLISLSTLFF